MHFLENQRCGHVSRNTISRKREKIKRWPTPRRKKNSVQRYPDRILCFLKPRVQELKVLLVFSGRLPLFRFCFVYVAYMIVFEWMGVGSPTLATSTAAVRFLPPVFLERRWKKIVYGEWQVSCCSGTRSPSHLDENAPPEIKKKKKKRRHQSGSLWRATPHSNSASRASRRTGATELALCVFKVGLRSVS